MPKDRKQRTRAHVLADLSVNHVERIALRCGFTVERMSHDYGLDLAIFTFDENGFREEGNLWVQLKATDHLKKSRHEATAVIRIERRDILAWIREAYPVLYDAAGDLAYFLCIQDYFTGPSIFLKLRGRTVTVRVPLENVVSEPAMRELASKKTAYLQIQKDRP